MHTFDVIPGSVVSELLDDRAAVMDLVGEAYLAHGAGRTVNPDSYFLRFADRPADRIIALPARLSSDDCDIAGIKWIASFPENVERDLPRASAVLLLSSMTDGYPYACLEAAGISAARTAASAAITVRALQATHPSDGTVGVLGAGVIARTVVDYLVTAGVRLERVLVHDPDPGSAAALAEYVEHSGRRAAVVSHAEAVEATTVLTATNTGVPHVDRAPVPGQIYLNVSLRDFTPQSLVTVQNIVDDVDHCLKAATSPHLAEQMCGHRDFITGTIPQLLAGTLTIDPDLGVVVSPFGLGVLDLAVGRWVHRTAVERGINLPIPDFFGSLRRW